MSSDDPSTAPDSTPRPSIPESSVPRLGVVVMGVSGSGKSSVGVGLASALGLHFIDGDDLHSAEAIAKMHAGIALQDADRWPWLDRIGTHLADAATWPRGVVVACSALKRVYRDRIRRASPGVRFIFLDGDATLLGSRMAARTGHYMPATLLASQLQALEPPGIDEPDATREGVDRPVVDIVEDAVRRLREMPVSGAPVRRP